MNKVRAHVIILIICLGSLSPLRAQTWEIGAGAGISYYVGDLNPTGHFQFPHPAGTIFFKRNFGNRWAFRGGFSYMGVYADDLQGSYNYQQVRNLRFYSHILEVSAVMELNFFPYRLNEPKTRKWTPYLFAGIGGYYYNPQASINGTMVDLQPLGTEGQGTPSQNNRPGYSPFMPNIPFGMGVKFNIKNKFQIALEYGMRITFNDYLDDVSNSYAVNSEIVSENGQTAGQASDMSTGNYAVYSNNYYQRGMKSDWDWYGYLGVSLIFHIKDPSTCPGGFKKL